MELRAYEMDGTRRLACRGAVNQSSFVPFLVIHPVSLFSSRLSLLFPSFPSSLFFSFSTIPYLDKPVPLLWYLSFLHPSLFVTFIILSFSLSHTGKIIRAFLEQYENIFYIIFYNPSCFRMSPAAIETTSAAKEMGREKDRQMGGRKRLAENMKKRRARKI